ncbi:MAG: hypothetical protein VKK03_00625, partial [Synechococcus sp.]|nr:hypothetical protein [Synechococcus sp.]
LPNGVSSPFSFIPTIQLASLSSSSFDSSVQSDAFSPKSPAVVVYSFGASSLVVDQNLSTCLSANCGEGPSRSTDADSNGQGKGVIPADL